MEIVIDPKDLEMRSTHKVENRSGMHTGMTCPGISIKHIPTGIETICKTERSQNKNMKKALRQLEIKLFLNSLTAREKLEHFSMFEAETCQAIFDYEFYNDEEDIIILKLDDPTITKIYTEVRKYISNSPDHYNPNSMDEEVKRIVEEIVL